MKEKRKMVLLLAVLAISPLAGSQTPIKSVDEQGNVTYSDQPVPEAVKTEVVPVQPGPSEEEVKAAKERLEKTEEMADEARKAREAREKEREEARKAAQAAKPDVVIIKEESGGLLSRVLQPAADHPRAADETDPPAEPLPAQPGASRLPSPGHPAPDGTPAGGSAAHHTPGSAVNNVRNSRAIIDISAQMD